MGPGATELDHIEPGTTVLNYTISYLGQMVIIDRYLIFKIY